MTHTYSWTQYHVVFSTAKRARLIEEPIQSRLWAYMGGIARENDFSSVTIGGMEEHVHLLLAIPPVLAVAKAVQLVKAGSSKWFNQTFKRADRFSWQEGYSVFSIGIAQIPVTRKYIANQKQHHATMSFDEEYIRFLRKHYVPYDEKYVLD
ncbi:MAG TPA: IS200/IS605 family transposase [Planctomycetota bacterium]|nr:IS200/IS605 family transposase [Planctomycetota bacterium]